MKKNKLFKIRSILILIGVFFIFAGSVQAGKLNNLVYERVNVIGPDSSGNVYTFNNSRDGWVYIANKGSREVTLTKDSVPEVLFLETEYDGSFETIRFLEAGEYQISSQMAKNLIVREIAEILYCAYGDDGRLFRNKNGSTGSRKRNNVFPHSTSLMSRNITSSDPYVSYWKEIGRNWMAWISTDVMSYTSVQSIKNYLTSSLGFTNNLYDGVVINEFGNVPDNYDLWAQAITELKTPGSGYEDKILHLYCGEYLIDSDKGRQLLKAIRDTDSLAVIEIYLNEYRTESEAVTAIQNQITSVIQSWEEAVPGSAAHAVFCTMPTDAIDYQEDSLPNVHYKKFLDMQHHAYATVPGVDRVGGLSAWTFEYTSPEMARYSAQLWRHYGINGATTPYNDEPYLLEYVLDGDFEIQNSGSPWTRTGSTAFGYQTYYGGYQSRFRGHANFHGDTYLKMTRNTSGANVFSQTVNNLVPGKLYSVQMYTADDDTMHDLGTVGDKHTANITVTNSEIKEPYVTMPYIANCSPLPNSAMAINLHFLVFEAQSTSATLIVSDWKDGVIAPTGSDIGQTLRYNYVQLEPYFDAPLKPIGTWTFNENTGATSADESGYYSLDSYKNDAALVGNVSWAPGSVADSYSVYFPGLSTGDKVLCGKNNGYAYDWSKLFNKVSLEVWWKPEEAWDGGFHRTIFGKSYEQFAIMRDNYPTAVAYDFMPLEATSYSIGQWHHIVMTWDASMSDPAVNNHKMYVNGVLVDEQYMNGSIPISYHNFPLGCGLECPVLSGGKLKGWIDECRIYDEEISAEQVMDNYLVGPTTIDAPDTCSDVTSINKGMIQDLNEDCRIDLKDFAELMSQWLSCIDPTDENCSKPWETN